MKKLLMAFIIALGALVVLVVGVAIYYQTTWRPTFPATPRPQLEASKDPVAIERGRYLFHAVAHCTNCHATQEEHWGSKIEYEALPRGGMGLPMGPMGLFRAPNITPDLETGVGSWSDADLARVILHGIRPDDTPALLMLAVGPMSAEDASAILSYMRTIPSVKNQVPDSEVGAVGKIMLQTVASILAGPKPALPVPPYVPAGGVSIQRGHYLAAGPAFCISCHSETDMASFALVRPFAGGMPEPDPWISGMEFRAPNLTSDPETGYLADVSEKEFADRFRAGRVIKTSFMPWDNYRKLTEADLQSIYRYLRSIEPVKNFTGPGHRKVGWQPPGG